MIIIKKKLTFPLKNYLHLLSILKNHGAESRLIGGCVRDALLDQQSADIDIATTLLPEQVIEVLTNNKIKFITVGVDFGTITAYISNEQIEITTLRKDLSSNGRHPQVTYTKNFQEDAERRDFTINSLSYCPFKQEIYDYFHGMDDLQKGRVIFIGDPASRIREDYLRILRFFRFSGRYSKTFDTEGLRACISLKNNLKLLSKERIKWEMDKIVAAANFEYTLKIISDAGILQIIFPVLVESTNLLTSANSFTKGKDIEFSLSAKYALIFYESNDLSSEELKSLKFSKKEAGAILSIMDFAKNLDHLDIMFLLKKAWLEKTDYLDYIVVCVSVNKLDAAIACKFVSNYKNLPKPKFPISGRHLIKLGLKGDAIGSTLAQLKNEWIRKDFKLSKSKLLNSLKNKNE